jgi:hypothetical protein
MSAIRRRQDMERESMKAGRGRGEDAVLEREGTRAIEVTENDRGATGEEEEKGDR